MKRIQDKFSVSAFVSEDGAFQIQPRASVRVIATTEDSMTWKVSSLSYPAEDYDEFEIEVYGGGRTTYESWTSSNSSYDTQVTVYDLKPNTRYEGTISAKYNGKWFEVGSDYDYTDEPSLPPPTLDGIDISNITPTSFYYRIQHTWGNYFEIKVWRYRDNLLVYQRPNTNYTYDTVSGLEPNTEYKIQCAVFNDNGSDYDYEFVTTAKPPQLPNPRVTITPSVNSATFSWSRPTGASILVCTIRDEASGSQRTIEFDAYSSPQTVSGLSPNQRHKVWFRYEPSSSNSDSYSPSDTVEDFFTTVKKPTFNWSVSFSSGTPFNIPASDWNTMCTVINQWRVIKGYSNYSFTTAQRGSPITASMYNQAITALRSITSSGLPSSVSIGDNCVASEFKKFATVINNLST